MTERKQTDYNQLVGIKDGELYMLDYVFDDGKDFKGATGSIFDPVSQQWIDECNSDENKKEHLIESWRNSVSSGDTEESLQEYIDTWPEDDNEFFGQDTSYIYRIPEGTLEKYFPGAVTFTCVGGGRCFEKNMKFDVIISQDMVDLINKYETK